MTFAEYNTDDNFDNKNGFESSLEELVKLGKAEGKTKEEIRSSLSPKWQKSSKLNKFDEYYGADLPKKTQTAPTVETTTTKDVVETQEPLTVSTTSNIKSDDKKYADSVDEIANYGEDKEQNRLQETSKDSLERLTERLRKANDTYKNIDDHAMDNLPTFMFRRFQNGEFGDPKGKDAKLRLAYFMINGVGTALQNASASIKGGAQQKSDYQIYKDTNMQQGLENRWNKYRADTNEAINLAKSHFDNEQDIDDTIRKISSEKRLQSKFNQMDSNQKLYLMEITKKIGDYVGNLSLNEVADLMTGAAFSGTANKDQAAAVVIAQLVKKTPKLLSNLPEGSVKNMVVDMLGGEGSELVAGIGGIGGSSNNNGNGTENLTGNLQGYKTIDGKELSFDFRDPNAGKKIQPVFDDLKERYKKGEIDEATFKRYYEPLYTEAKKHPGSKTVFASDSDEAIRKANVEIRVDLSQQLEDLNTSARNGTIKPSKYEEKFNELRTKAIKYGASEKDVKSIDKGKISNEKILKATEKKNKKK